MQLTLKCLIILITVEGNIQRNFHFFIQLKDFTKHTPLTGKYGTTFSCLARYFKGIFISVKSSVPFTVFIEKGDIHFVFESVIQPSIDGFSYGYAVTFFRYNHRLFDHLFLVSYSKLELEFQYNHL